MTANPDNQIKLCDGLTVGYAEYGDPQGTPVLHFHGLPSSRLEGSNPDLVDVAERLHVRLILPDRPGVGLSDFRPYTVVTYPDIVAALADRLSLDRFAVMGLSGGGIYVAACAWKIPQRLTAACIVSGIAPFDLPGVRASLNKQDRQVYDLAVRLPWLFRIMLWKIASDVRKDPAKVFSILTDISEPDRIALAQPNVRRAFEQMVVEAFRQGTRGVALDWRHEAQPWGFPLAEIKMPVQVHHGEADRLVPIEHARVLATAIPNARVSYYPNEGHTLIVSHFEELLKSIIPPS